MTNTDWATNRFKSDIDARDRTMAFVRNRFDGRRLTMGPVYRALEAVQCSRSTLEWQCFASLWNWESFTQLSGRERRHRLGEIATLARRLRRKLESTGELRGWPVGVFMPEGSIGRGMNALALPPLEDILAVVAERAQERARYKRLVAKVKAPNAKRTYFVKELSIRLKLTATRWLDDEVAIIASVLFRQNVGADLVRKLRADIVLP